MSTNTFVRAKSSTQSVRIAYYDRSNNRYRLVHRRKNIMTKSAIVSSKLAPPVGPFSPGIRTDRFIYFSGQVGQDPATGKLAEGGIVAETERLFKNLSAVLEAAGKNFDYVVRVGVFLTNMSDFATMN